MPKRATPELDAARKRLAVLDAAIPEAKCAVRVINQAARLRLRALKAVQRIDDTCPAPATDREMYIKRQATAGDSCASIYARNVLTARVRARAECEKVVVDELVARMLDGESSDDDDSSDNRPLRPRADVEEPPADESDGSSSSDDSDDPAPEPTDEPDLSAATNAQQRNQIACERMARLRAYRAARTTEAAAADSASPLIDTLAWHIIRKYRRDTAPGAFSAASAQPYSKQ